MTRKLLLLLLGLSSPVHANVVNIFETVEFVQSTFGPSGFFSPTPRGHRYFIAEGDDVAITFAAPGKQTMQIYNPSHSASHSMRFRDWLVGPIPQQIDSFHVSNIQMSMFNVHMQQLNGNPNGVIGIPPPESDQNPAAFNPLGRSFPPFYPEIARIGSEGGWLTFHSITVSFHVDTGYPQGAFYTVGNEPIATGMPAAVPDAGRSASLLGVSISVLLLSSIAFGKSISRQCTPMET